MERERRMVAVGEPEPPRKVDVRRVAVHEAGHAVVGLAHGLELDWVRVSEGTEHELVTEAGRCEWRGGTGSLREQIAARPVELGSMCFAGSLAEEHIFGGADEEGIEQDYGLWRGAIGWTEAADPPLAHRLEQQNAALAQARRDVRAHEDAIRTVSKALLASPDMRLDGETVRGVLGAADGP
jgi:hypothetical protein